MNNPVPHRRVAVARHLSARRAWPFGRQLSQIRDLALSASTLRNLALGFYVFSITVPRALDPLPADADLNPAVYAQGSTFNQLVLISCLALAVVVFLRFRTDVSKVWYASAPYLPLVLLAVLSIVWADYPDLSARRVLRVIMELAMVAILMSTFPNKAAVVRVLFWTLALVVLLDLAAFATSAAHTPLGYGGINADKNAVGEATFMELPVFGMVIADPRIVRRRGLAILLLVASLFLMGISLSKTSVSTTVFCLTLIAVLGTYRTKWRWPVLSVVLIVAVTAVVMAALMGFTMGDISVMMTGSASFSGREFLWDYIFRRIAEAPIQGHGFGSVWGTMGDKAIWLQVYRIYFDANQAHNGYLDIALQLGVIGVAAMIFAIAFEIVRQVRVFGRQGISRYMLFSAYVVFGFLIYNMTESLYFRASSSLWVCFLIACMLSGLPETVEGPKRRSARPAPQPAAMHPDDGTYGQSYDQTYGRGFQ